MNYRSIAKQLALVVLATGAAMLPCCGWALWLGELAAAWGFLAGMAAAGGTAAVLWRVSRTARPTIFQREALAIVAFSWLVATALGAIPFVVSGVLPSPVDAYFESTSGFTTTGSTVLERIDEAPQSILLWRAMTQWIGGIGIVMLFIAVLPYLGAGGKQLYQLESPGPNSGPFHPRIRDTAKFLLRFYLGLSAALFAILTLEGLSVFDALCHTFSTVSTGGFSTRQASIAAYDSALIEVTLVAFMIVASLNFALFAVPGVRGKLRAVFRDPEVRIFLAILLLGVTLVSANLMGLHGRPGPALQASLEEGFEGVRYEHAEETTYPPADAIRKSLFQVVSIMTTTGYVTDDFDLWPHFSRSFLLLLMFIGGCAGSTAGGFKVVRIVMLLKMAYWRLEQSFRPVTIRALRIGDEVVHEEIQRRVSGFFVLYLLWFILATLALSAFGLPFESATTAVLATMNNIGPGLGLVGANLDFHLMPSLVKLLLSLSMLVGRLEIFTLYVLFLPAFWRVG